MISYKFAVESSKSEKEDKVAQCQSTVSHRIREKQEIQNGSLINPTLSS